jgi:hypothetical protein
VVLLLLFVAIVVLSHCHGVVTWWCFVVMSCQLLLLSHVVVGCGWTASGCIQSGLVFSGLEGGKEGLTSFMCDGR